MKVLVTGSAGFIGFHLVKKLIAQNYDVYGLDNINDYYSIKLKYDRLKDCGIEPEMVKNNQIVRSKIYSNYHFAKIDLSDEVSIFDIFKNQKFDIVVNLAAQAGVRYSMDNPHAYVKSNISGFLNVLEACKMYPPQKLLYASSSSVYGKNTEQPFAVTDKVDTPISVYAATKKSNELMAHTYSHLFNLTTIGLRFFTVYGPWGRPDMAPFLFSDSIVNKKEMKVYNHGNMKRDFTYIDDIVESISRIIIAETKPYSLFNIGNGTPIDLKLFISCLENEFNQNAIKVNYPLQPGDLLETWADTKELVDLISYIPSTKIEDGVKVFVEWYKEYFNLKNI